SCGGSESWATGCAHRARPSETRTSRPISRAAPAAYTTSEKAETPEPWTSPSDDPAIRAPEPPLRRLHLRLRRHAGRHHAAPLPRLAESAGERGSALRVHLGPVREPRRHVARAHRARALRAVLGPARLQHHCR